jgi:hypothetical protein
MNPSYEIEAKIADLAEKLPQECGPAWEKALQEIEVLELQLNYHLAIYESGCQFCGNLDNTCQCIAKGVKA